MEKYKRTGIETEDTQLSVGWEEYTKLAPEPEKGKPVEEEQGEQGKQPKNN